MGVGFVLHVEIRSGELECYGAVVDHIYEKRDWLLKLNLGFTRFEILSCDGVSFVLKQMC